MSFPRYPAYKPSGVEWLGQIPDHWSVVPLARISSQPGTIFIDGDWVESKDLADEGIRYITTGNVGQGNYKDQGRGYISQSTFDRLRCTEVLPGDVLISRLNLPIGRACVAPDLGERVITSVDNVIVRPDDSYSRSYLAHMLSSASHFANMEILARGTTMQRISRSVLGQVRFAFPGFHEQKAIATFLDHETAKIDALIAEQQRLIELLQEKRQAVISHAVTKGLNPHAPMKDSGVEWLGEVPEHWEKSRLRALFRQEKRQDQPTSPVLSVYRDYGVILKDSRDDNHNKTPESLSAYQLVNRDDLVVNKMKAWQGSLGVSVLHGITSPDYAVFTPHHNEFSLYLHFLLRSCRMTSVYRSISNGIRPAQWRIEPGVFLDLPVFLPPTHEQELIVGHVSRESEKFDQLVKESESFVNLLQERRSALISAAVTGQIDVRGLVLEAEAA
jgi:type I restriction enzyme S subunit